MAHARKPGIAIALVLVVALAVACAPEAGRPEDTGPGAGRVVAAQGVTASEETDAKVEVGTREVEEAEPADDLPALPADAASPEEAARSFFDWYIAYTDMAAGRTVRADEAYRNHPLLTEELVGRIEETYASMQGGGYDPFLCAQDVPTAVSVGPARVYEDQAWLTVYTTFPGHSLDLTLREADGNWRIDEIACRLPDATDRTPEQVVRDFYTWYIHYPGNVMVDKAYYGFGMYLTQDLIEEIDGIIAGFDRGGYDPFLCAQDVPMAVSVGPARVYEDQAWLTMYTTFPGHSLDLALTKSGDLWRISEITCHAPEEAASRTPEQVTQTFYNWYIHYPGNVMVDKAYYGFGMYLTQDLIEEIDGIIAGFDRGGYDPFLCAQDVPTAVSVGPARVYEDQAWLTVYTTFPGHSLDLTLREADGNWRIDEIACRLPDATDRTPEQVVRDFYTWYIHYPGNVMVDKAYYGFGMYLTQDLIEEIDGIIAGFDRGGYDPFLCAQDVPMAVSVGPAEVSGDEATLTAYTTFPGHSLEVTLTRGGDLWRISSIRCQTPTDASERTPEEVVSHFYNWYVRYPGNPLADRAFYGFGMYLTQDLIEEIIEVVEGFEMGGHDPILLAQDLPTDITVQEAEVRGDDATVRVDTSWDGHALTLRLVRDGSLWKIDGIERAQ